MYTDLEKWPQCPDPEWGHGSCEVTGTSQRHGPPRVDVEVQAETHVCQAFCLHYLNPPHNPVKLPASWCGLCFSPFLEYLLVLSRTRASAWRGSHLLIPKRWHAGQLPSTLG